jgi:hypothetical protein
MYRGWFLFQAKKEGEGEKIFFNRVIKTVQQDLQVS